MSAPPSETSLTVAAAGGVPKSFPSAMLLQTPVPSPVRACAQARPSGRHVTDESKTAGAGNVDAEPPAAATGAVPTKKRTDVVTWDEYFMAVAFLSSQRSKGEEGGARSCMVGMVGWRK